MMNRKRHRLTSTISVELTPQRYEELNLHKVFPVKDYKQKKLFLSLRKSRMKSYRPLIINVSILSKKELLCYF